MTKTQIQKVFAALALGALAVGNFASVGAAQIGTGSVVGTGAFDTAINWDDTFPGSASGSVTDIVIKARVLPSLNMAISAEEIDLGTLLPGVEGTGSLNLEIGTNAVNGVTITARSQSGGLTNLSDSDIKISSITSASDPAVGESYKFASTALTGVASDSSYGATFAATGLTALEVVDNVLEHTVYNSNKPEATNLVDDVEFVVSATTVAETPAGDYQDKVTFTVTGSF